MSNTRPTICLNMIVRNEAHIVREVLDCVAKYISYWVIVDTGSDDGTQDVIRAHTAELGIPGEIHERPWQNFGVNRSQALDLAQGHADYIWVIDADDLVMGELDLSNLTADAYDLRLGGSAGLSYSPGPILRRGLPWRYLGVVHEYVDCDQPFARVRVEGDYFIDSRRLGGRNLDPQKYARDRDLLLAEMERDPNDSRSAFYLAQSYFDLGDFANSKIWYARRAEMGGWDEEVYYSKLRVGESMARLNEPWPEVQDAYLSAWEYRPIRAEALYAIAHRYRANERYQLGYMFATQAAQIPLPEFDRLFVGGDVHNWRAMDEQAVCASWINKKAEAFELSRKLLARSDVPDGDRGRISSNRDLQVPMLIGSAAQYSEQRARALSSGPRGEVTVSLVMGQTLAATEHTLNTFINTCNDPERIDRVLLLHSGLTAEDRIALVEKYRFLDFVDATSTDHPIENLARIRQAVGGRFWLHLGRGWQFFAPEMLISRLRAVMVSEPDVFQVAVNFNDAEGLLGACASERDVRRTPNGGRYMVTDSVAAGPALFDVLRLDQVGGFGVTDSEPFVMLAKRAAAMGLRTATLDEVLCTRITAG